MTQLARTFMADDADFETCVQNALGVMGSLESVDSIGIWRMQDGLMHHRHQWTAPSIPPRRSATIAVPARRGGVRADAGAARGSDVAGRPAPVRGGSRPKPTRSPGEVRSPSSPSPMVTDGLLSGFVSFTSYSDENIFAPTHRSTLRAAAGIFAEAFARHEVQARLEHQARHDSLTGLANRWAFARRSTTRCGALAAGESRGVARVALRSRSFPRDQRLARPPGG